MEIIMFTIQTKDKQLYELLLKTMADYNKDNRRKTDVPSPEDFFGDKLKTITKKSIPVPTKIVQDSVEKKEVVIAKPVQDSVKVEKVIPVKAPQDSVDMDSEEFINTFYNKGGNAETLKQYGFADLVSVEKEYFSTILSNM